MKELIVEIFEQISSVAFWEELLMQFYYLGPFVPIALTAIESLIPALPLAAIVILNVAGHGLFLGMIYSWIGASIGSTIVFYFFRKVIKRYFSRFVEKRPKLIKARDWVNNIKPRTLFLLGFTPFAPSSILNIAFGLSDFDDKTYIKTMLLSKFSMVAMMSIFGQSFVSAFKNPWFILVCAVLFIIMYFIYKKINKKHGMK